MTSKKAKKRRSRCSSCRKLTSDTLSKCIAFQNVKLCQVCLKKGCTNCRYGNFCKAAQQVNPSVIERAIAKLVEIESIKDKISAARDDLRRAHSELDDICATLKEGVPMIKNGLREVRDGLDKVSELL